MPRPLIVPRLRVALAVSAVAAASALGVAVGSERWGGLVPCALCLVERWPYRLALGLAVAGLLSPRPVARLALFAVLLAVLAGLGAAAVHVGVEQRWWDSPLPECAAPRLAGLSMAQRLAQMPATPSKACEDPTYLWEVVPVSFAQLNFLYALVFVACVASFLWRTRRSEA